MLLQHDGKEEKQITVEEFAAIMGISETILEKIKKNPVFEINPRKTKPDKLNGGTTAPAGRSMRPLIQRKIGGITFKFRYATSVIPDDVNPRKSTYEPKRLMFMDDSAIYKELEEAVFIYALPTCMDSPNPDRDWHYRFQNKEKEALQVTERAAKIGKCLTMINGGLSDTDVILVAKGIFAQNSGQVQVIPNPSARNKTLAEVRADLTTLALKDPDFFLANADNDINTFYGQMFDGVDRGIFEVRTGAANVRAWYWNAGPKKDDKIAEIKPGQKDFDVLRMTIEANPNAYYDTLVKSIQQASGKENMAQFLAKKKAEGNQTSDLVLKSEVTISNPNGEQIPAGTGYKSEGQEQPPFIPGDGDEIEDLGDEYMKVPGLDLSTLQNPLEQGKAKELAPFVLPVSFEESNVLLASFNAGKKANGAKNGPFWKMVKEGKVNAENVAVIAGQVLGMV